jgi:hypothetical protein
VSLFLGGYRKQNKTTGRVVAVFGVVSLRVRETRRAFIACDDSWPSDDESLLPRERLQEP